MMLRKEDQKDHLSYLYQVDDKDDNHITISPHLGGVICVNNKQTRAVCKCPFGDPVEGFRCPRKDAVRCSRCRPNFHLSGEENSTRKRSCHVPHVAMYDNWHCRCTTHIPHVCLYLLPLLLFAFRFLLFAFAARPFDFVGSGVAGPSEVWNLRTKASSDARDGVEACFAAVKANPRRVLVLH